MPVGCLLHRPRRLERPIAPAPCGHRVTRVGCSDDERRVRRLAHADRADGRSIGRPLTGDQHFGHSRAKTRPRGRRRAQSGLEQAIIACWVMATDAAIRRPAPGTAWTDASRGLRRSSPWTRRPSSTVVRFTCSGRDRKEVHRHLEHLGLPAEQRWRAAADSRSLWVSGSGMLHASSTRTARAADSVSET